MQSEEWIYNSGQADQAGRITHANAFITAGYVHSCSASLVQPAVWLLIASKVSSLSRLSLGNKQPLKDWLLWTMPFVLYHLQASPGSEPHLFDPFLSIYIFFHQGSLSCICLISARRPSGMLSFPLLRLPLILLIPPLHTGWEINIYHGPIVGNFITTSAHTVWKLEFSIKHSTRSQQHVMTGRHEKHICYTLNKFDFMLRWII